MLLRCLHRVLVELPSAIFSARTGLWLLSSAEYVL